MLNSLVLVIFVKYKDLRTPTNMFIIGVAVGDLAAAIAEIPLPMIASFKGRWIFGRRWCYFEGFVAYFVALAGLYMLTAVSVDRYILIVKPLSASKVTKRAAALSIVACLAGSLLWSVPPLIGWSEYTLEGGLISCSVLWQSQELAVVTYNAAIFVFCFFVPVGIMVFCNFKVYMTVRHVARHRVWNMNDPRSRKKLELEKRMAKTIVAMIGAFVGCWSPYAVVALWSAFIDPTAISPLWCTLPAVFAKSSIIWNPIIYVATNKQFQLKFLEMIPCQSCKPTIEEDHSSGLPAPEPRGNSVAPTAASSAGDTALTNVENTRNG